MRTISQDTAISAAVRLVELADKHDALEVAYADLDKQHRDALDKQGRAAAKISQLERETQALGERADRVDGELSQALDRVTMLGRELAATRKESEERQRQIESLVDEVHRELERSAALEKRIGEAIETFERSAELADEMDDKHSCAMSIWEARAEAFVDAARILRGDAGDPKWSEPVRVDLAAVQQPKTTPAVADADAGDDGDSNGWRTDGLPPTGAWADVKVETGEVYTGAVAVADAGTGRVALREQLDGGEFSTWSDCIEQHRCRTGWRLAERPSEAASS